MFNFLPFQKYEEYYTESFMGFPIISKDRIKKKSTCPELKKEIYHADIIIPEEEPLPLKCCNQKKTKIKTYKVDKIYEETTKSISEEKCNKFEETCLYSYSQRGKHKLTCFTYRL